LYSYVSQRVRVKVWVRDRMRARIRVRIGDNHFQTLPLILILTLTLTLTDVGQRYFIITAPIIYYILQGAAIHILLGLGLGLFRVGLRVRLKVLGWI
jgi:hypothetical protein